MTEVRSIRKRLRCYFSVSIIPILFLLLVSPIVLATDYDNDTSIKFRWRRPEGGGSAYYFYRVYLSIDGEPNWNLVGEVGSAGSKITYTIRASHGHSYRIRVTAQLPPGGIESPPSEPSDAVICDTVSPTTSTISYLYEKVENFVIVTLARPSSDEHFSNYQLKGGNFINWTDTTQVGSFIFPIDRNIDNVLQIRGRDLAGNVGQSASIIILRYDDIDNDGLLDKWEIQYFYGLWRDGSGDCDRDKMTDYEEYMAGTSPVDPKSLFALIQISSNSREVLLKWSSTHGRHYRVLSSSDLKNWNKVGSVILSQGLTTMWTDTTAEHVSCRFYKIEVLPIRIIGPTP